MCAWHCATVRFCCAALGSLRASKRTDSTCYRLAEDKIIEKNWMLNGRVARRNGQNEKKERACACGGKLDFLFGSSRREVMIRLYVCFACSLAFHLINHSHFDGADTRAHAHARTTTVCMRNAKPDGSLHSRLDWSVGRPADVSVMCVHMNVAAQLKR